MAVGIIHLGIYPFRNCHRHTQKVHLKLKEYLYWDGTIRLFMVLFFDITLFAILNLHTVDWQSEFASIKASNAVAVISMIIACGTLVLFTVSYFRLPKVNRTEKFAEKFEPLLSGTDRIDVRAKWYLILVPTLHFVNRLLFVSLVIVEHDKTWL